MSYSNSFPTQRPSLNLVFNGGSDQLDSRLSYTRSSTGTFMSNEKHKSSENLLQYSNPVTSHWTETNTTITVNSTAAPDGTTTASNVLETSATGYHETRETFSCTNAVAHTATFYAKANGRTVIRFLPRTSSGVIATVEFTLSGAGSESLISGAATRSIAAVGAAGGWYKMTVTFTGNATATGDFQINICESAGTDSYAGDATKGVYLWGCAMSSLQEQILNPTSGSIHREFASTLKTSATNAPRFEYSATDGQSVGLLIESQATNKATYSEDFTNATYNKYRATIESASAIAPDGSLTASFLREDATASNTHYLNAVTATGLSVGTTKYAVSIFVKAAGRSKIKIYDNNQNTSGSTTFDLSNGTVVTGDGSIQNCGNGWYRCTIIPTCNYSATSSVYMFLDDGSGTSYTGDNFSGILVWGYQLETGVSASSSYIKSNSGSSTTRSADSCSVADFGYTGGPISIVAESSTSDVSSASKVIFRLDSGDVYTNYFQGSLLVNYVTAGASTQALQYPSSVTAGTDYKVASRVGTNSINSAANGTAQTVDTSAVIPDLAGATLHIGGISGSQCLNGNLKNLKVFSAPLSDTNLTAMTSS